MTPRRVLYAALYGFAALWVVVNLYDAFGGKL